MGVVFVITVKYYLKIVNVFNMATSDKYVLEGKISKACDKIV